jgi:hypothetical protein
MIFSRDTKRSDLLPRYKISLCAERQNVYSLGFSTISSLRQGDLSRSGVDICG